ncbi:MULTISPECIES: Sec-independent protein translocase subunit TatA [unclassified Streptomyces]|uniref:Sec-independent protein translocase subunit TatA n=1 Tax=Streptomycetaceae TaxID=2062 RepID=UPI002E7A693E|nr:MULTISPECIES: Sec-independent protein translocase subunit TatA [unclassified Streptomyces]MED7950756.1 Sec-independent protein translocase subunit TatA [Streptomyces sp. BE303]MEE1821011.1 Sec-independent protein translocase subunit TatA [Streptomyces sp. BE20]
MRISPIAILVVVVLAILLFGAKRLPDLARSLGKSMRILKSETQAMRSEGAADASAPPAPAVADDVAAKTIQSAPGASATSRPVSEQPSGRSAGAAASDGGRAH